MMQFVLAIHNPWSYHKNIGSKHLQIGHFDEIRFDSIYKFRYFGN